MHKNLFLLAFILFLFSCKKDNETPGTPGDDEDCVMSFSTKGEIGATQYIVAFSPSINSRTASRISLEQVSKNVLTRNTIDVSALKHSYAGEPGGFIAKISAAQAELLRHDAAIQAVERIELFPWEIVLPWLHQDLLHGM